MTALGPDSRWSDLGGRTHWIDFGGPADGPLLVMVHGLGGSHANWLALAPLLTPTCRVVALDLVGFGRTRGDGRSASVPANRELLHRFLREVVGTPAILVGNSMGGLLSTLEAAEHPRDVAGLVLLDPALPPSPRGRPDPMVVGMFGAYLTPAGRRAIAQRRSSPEQMAMDVLRLCCVDPSRVPKDVLQAHLQLARTREYSPEMEAEFVAATRTLLWTLARRRTYAKLQRHVVAPVLLIHGDRDRLIHVASARAAARRNPHWRYEELPDIGHVPQLEAADRTAELILDWMGAEGARATEQARGAAAPAA